MLTGAGAGAGDVFRLPGAGRAVEQAVRDGLIPGAVLMVGHDGKIVHRKAYGQRALVPAREPMTVDTIFDVASLTKVIATTPALMKLFEQGKLRIARSGHGVSARVSGRQKRHHHSRSDDAFFRLASRSRSGTRLVRLRNRHRTRADRQTRRPAGTHFVYSDINFELLGEIVHRLSGKMLDEYAREKIFEPLGMQETMFRPPASLRPRIAPTEIDPATGQPFRGVVHDPTARYMGGVAGHAGVFTTASDLAKFAADDARIWAS